MDMMWSKVDKLPKQKLPQLLNLKKEKKERKLETEILLPAISIKISLKIK